MGPFASRSVCRVRWLALGKETPFFECQDHTIGKEALQLPKRALIAECNTRQSD